MQRQILSIVNGAVVALLAATCAPGLSADRADTWAAHAESVAIPRRDTVAGKTPEIVVGRKSPPQNEGGLLTTGYDASSSYVGQERRACDVSTLQRTA
jgi:hypothetical protein